MILVLNKYKDKPIGQVVNIMRGFSPLANPYSHLKNTKTEFYLETRAEAVAAYWVWLAEKIQTKDVAVCEELNRIYLLAKQENVSLWCCCAPLECHGYVIKEIIESKL